MADLDKAIAAYRASNARYQENATNENARAAADDAADLLAALDEARCEAVVWVHRESDDIEYSKKPWMGAEWQPLYAAPPAAMGEAP